MNSVSLKNQQSSRYQQDNENNLQDYLQALYIEQKNYQKEGRYMEAEIMKKKIIKIRGEISKRIRNSLAVKHNQEKSEVQEAHREEIQEFNRYWNEKFQEYEQQAHQIEQKLLNKHQQENEQFQEELQNSISFKPKESSQIINLRKIEVNLAKEENYHEAHKVQKQIQALEKVEVEKWNRTRRSKIQTLLQQLTLKQENQVNALRQRIEQGFQEQKKIRSHEQEKLRKKFRNFMIELENQQNQERVKFDKNQITQGNTSKSRVNKRSSRVLQNIHNN